MDFLQKANACYKVTSGGRSPEKRRHLEKCIFLLIFPLILRSYLQQKEKQPFQLDGCCCSCAADANSSLDALCCACAVTGLKLRCR